MKMKLNVIFKRFVHYILKKMVNPYVATFSVINCSLLEGKGEIDKIDLDVKALNEKISEYNLPFEVLHGSIDFLTIDAPMPNLLDESSVIDVTGLKLVVQPKQRPEDVSMFDSMWGSMTSSLQLAEDCLNANEEDEEDEEFEGPDRQKGVKMLSQTITQLQELISEGYTYLCRVQRLHNLQELFVKNFQGNLKIKFHGSSLKIKHALPNQTTGVSLEIKIASAEYFDESCVNTPPTGLSQEKEKSEFPLYSFKRVVLEGISLYTAEFLSEESPFTSVQQVASMEHVDSSKFVPGSPEMPPTHVSLNMKKTNEPSFHSDPVLIGKLNGQHEIRFKLKQKEVVIGPKVDVEFNFGAINLFLTPQQVHLLYILFNGFIKPTDRSIDASKAQLSAGNKPMRPADYALVEQELLRQQEKSEVMSRSLKNQQGWSSHSLDESDEDFHLMTMENKTSHETTPSNSSQDDFLSSTNSDVKSNYGVSNVQAILLDPVSELTHFHGCISSFLMIILHDDSVQETFTADTRSDRVGLKVQTETFFSNLSKLQLSGLNFKDFPSAREPISKLCETNHLRLMASGIVLDGSKASSSMEGILKCNVSFHQFEVLECLFNSPAVPNEVQNPKYMQLMAFVKKDDQEACFKLSYCQVECISRNRTNKLPANKLDIELGTMMCDVDISLTGRIRTLLNFSNVADYADTKRDYWQDSDVGLVTRISSKTDVTLSSSSVIINLRFPVPDLRSVHGMERTPWWQQNIHKEVLILELQDLSFKTTVDGDEEFEKYEIQCQDIHGLFKMSSSEEPISFLRVSVDPDVDEICRNGGFDWPRLVIRRMTKVASPDLEGAALEDDDDDDYSSMSFHLDLLVNHRANEPSPFHSTNAIYCNREEGNAKVTSEHDEIVKPSDKKTMLNFIEKTTNKSECVFEFTLPTVNIVFPNREFYELLYNRLGTDLVLWENTSLTSTSTYDSCGFKVHIPGLDESFNKGPHSEQYPAFKPFSNDSNSDSEEEGTLYLSVLEHSHQQKEKHRKTNNDNLTKLSFSFTITKGSLLVNTPLLDDKNEVVPDHCGKLLLHAEDGLIFFASSYKGDPNESYICLLAEKSTLYHEGSQKKETKHSTVQPMTGLMNNNLKCIIYESEKGMLLNNSTKDMLKFAVHAVKNPKQQIKTFKIAIEIAGATLRYYMLPASHVWLNQMINFLKVEDFPVSGYTPPSVVTELHLNLANCAIEYRPTKLPYRVALTVENFNLCCNVTPTTPFFIMFRIISEELRVFLTNNTEAKNVNLRNDYVCVIDTGLISISIKTSQDQENNPKFVMDVMNNKIQLQTCADSFKALLELITYLTINGDLEFNPNSQKQKNDDIKQGYAKFKDVEPDDALIDKAMAEAMKECSIQNENDETFKNNSDAEYPNTDDEFCILEDDPGVGLIPRNGEPVIRKLTDEPFEIIDDHFSVPPGKLDVLKAPKDFPDPLFLLQFNMSLIWHLYGGNDFKKCNSKKNSVGKNSIKTKSDNLSKAKYGVTFCDQKTENNESVSFCNVTAVPKNLDSNVVQFSMEDVTINQNQRISSLESRFHKGGPGRNHDVLMELKMNKMQFRHEVYPMDSEHASRYVLAIQDFVILDHLASSNIDTFLYQYVTTKNPQESSANLIKVTAVFLRPDPKRQSEECDLEISLKPLRLNVDQDSLMFLIKFFQEVLELSDAESSEDAVTYEENIPSDVDTTQAVSSTNETFFRYFAFYPGAFIKIDYQGKRVEMKQGALKGLLLGLGQLKDSQLRLKEICYRQGLLGYQKVICYALNVWQQDILKNQLPDLLRGVGPMHSFVQLFQGMKDLFCMPVMQYRKDGQVIRGLQRGLSSFSKSTAVATLDLTSGLLDVFQDTALVAYDMVSPDPRTSGRFLQNHRIYPRNSQPAGMLEGLSFAYDVVKEAFEDTAHAFVETAKTGHKHKGVPGAIGGVLRLVPASLITIPVAVTRASDRLVGGFKNALVPDAHQENILKYKKK